MNSCHTALVVGASRGIGVALTQQLLQDPGIQRVYATYRKNDTAEALLAIDDERLRTLQVDVTNDEDLQRLAKNIRVNQDSPDFVINAAGILHEGALQPEKSLNQCKQQTLGRVFQANVKPGKLYTPTQSADRILRVVNAGQAQDSGRFVNWDGGKIPW